VGREVKDRLQGSARESAQVKETATEATQDVKDQAKPSDENVKGQAESGHGGRP
jgi:uncharacterized protein YjbJ (UPF0337 family)